jgi:hypothetical protein
MALVGRRQAESLTGGADSSDGPVTEAITVGASVHLYVVQMNETGVHYLNRVRPTALRRVVLDASSLAVIDVIDEDPTGADLYGWAVTDDGIYTYLYSHWYRQFGFDTLFGFGECAVEAKLARVPLGEFEADRDYWNGAGWTNHTSEAVAVVDGTFAISGDNPAQIRFDGERFLIVEKPDDWWGTTIEFGVSVEPQGPFRHVGSIAEPRKCDRWTCNTYFASWVPWNDSDGRPIWSVGHNRWDGSETYRHLCTYRPTFSTVDV